MCFLMFPVFCQDRKYYDQDGYEVSSLELCHHYKVVDHSDPDTNKVVEREYYKLGQIKAEKTFNPYKQKVLHGKRKEWFENGKVKRDMEYRNGNLNGQLFTYWENGIMKRKDSYLDGKLIEGKVWNSDGSEATYYDFEISPEFPGGFDKLAEYLGRKVKYPKKSRRKGIEGRVLVRFTVQKDGSITNVRVAESANEELDAEAVRVVKKMPDWTVGMEDGEKVRIGINLPINFRIRLD